MKDVRLGRPQQCECGEWNPSGLKLPEECRAKCLTTEKAPVAKLQCSDGLRGEWYIDSNDAEAIYHTNFEHDIMIVLSGDFKDHNEQMNFLMTIRDKLNKAT